MVYKIDVVELALAHVIGDSRATISYLYNANPLKLISIGI